MDEAIKGLNNEKAILTRNYVDTRDNFKRMSIGWRLRELDQEIRDLLALHAPEVTGKGV